jgi:hypothetical protein
MTSIIYHGSRQYSLQSLADRHVVEILEATLLSVTSVTNSSRDGFFGKNAPFTISMSPLETPTSINRIVWLSHNMVLLQPSPGILDQCRLPACYDNLWVGSNMKIRCTSGHPIVLHQCGVVCAPHGHRLAITTSASKPIVENPLYRRCVSQPSHYTPFYKYDEPVIPPYWYNH